MFAFFCRALGMIVLALAVVLAVLDMTRSISASAVILTPLAQNWADIAPQLLLSFREAVTGSLHPLIWDPVITFVLGLPGWLVFWLIAMLLLWAGQRRERHLGRFASH